VRLGRVPNAAEPPGGGPSASNYSHRASRYPCAAGDRRFLASARALGASTMYSSGPESSIWRMRGCFWDARAILLSTVKPRLIWPRFDRLVSMVVVADPEARLGEKVGEIQAQVVADFLQTVKTGICQRL
jgi:hypothetical protein